MRRTRIKGVANIPQRKKIDNLNKSEEESEQNTKILLDVKKEEVILNTLVQKQIETGKQVLLQEIIKPIRISDEGKINALVKSEESAAQVLEVKGFPIINEDIKSNSASRDKPTAINISSTIKQKLVSVRRKPIKPIVTVSGLIRKAPDSAKLVEKNEKQLEDTTSVKILTNGIDTQQCLTVQDQKQTIIKIEQNILLHPPKSPLSICNSQIGIGQLKSHIINAPDNRNSTSFQINTRLDPEYPIPPASPNKINRSRIKAIPRIGYRKISFSASESEDDSKRTNCRIRHDSQSSNISAIQDTCTESLCTQKPKEFSSIIQRKCKRIDWSGKLADARREFTRKFMCGKPDHKKLTMIDLIFYNPSTNPLKKENCKKPESNSRLSTTNEEDIDNPAETEVDPSKDNSEEPSKISDEENEIPAPQIKIGPSGELILDEKSLVIENKETKRNREELQKSKIVDGNVDRPYGVFKKIKRSKDWSHSETLRFYKALSTIGTDFSLMCDLFPSRSRRELKMKFKKEERINQTLIDKAVMEPCSFDYEQLKKEFALVEIERKELEQQKIKTNQLKKGKQNKRSIKFLNLTQEHDPVEVVQIESETAHSCLSDRHESKSDINTDRDDELIQSSHFKSKPRKRKTANFLKKTRQRKLDIIDVLSDSDSVENDSDESELLWRPTQTRYGRKTRKREIYEPDFKINEDVIVPRKILKPLSDTIPSQEPGSIMMISSKTSDGQSVVKIFMVTDKKVENSGTICDSNTDHLLPIAMIETGHTDVEEEEEIIENNYTIPADPVTENVAENVTENIQPDIEKIEYT